MTSVKEKEEELISQGLELESDEINTFNFNPAKHYIEVPIMNYLGLNSPSATFNLTSIYTKGGMEVRAYKGSQWETSHALKKFNFTKGLALSIVTGALIAFIPGVNLAAYYNYVYGNKSNGTVTRELYNSGGSAWFYNNWADTYVADVAYQQYRYIEGFRSTAPKWNEF